MIFITDQIAEIIGKVQFLSFLALVSWVGIIIMALIFWDVLDKLRGLKRELLQLDGEIDDLDQRIKFLDNYDDDRNNRIDRLVSRVNVLEQQEEKKKSSDCPRSK